MTNEWIEWTGENRIRTPTIFRGNNTCSSSFLNNNQHNYKFNPSQTSISTTTTNMGLKSPTSSPPQQTQQQQQQLHHSLFKTLYQQQKARGLYFFVVVKFCKLTRNWFPNYQVTHKKANLSLESFIHQHVHFFYETQFFIVLCVKTNRSRLYDCAMTVNIFHTLEYLYTHHINHAYWLNTRLTA